jgi:hypothetical protein
MPELKSMTAIKMLEDLRDDIDVLRRASISEIDQLNIDDKTFDALDNIWHGFSEFSRDIVKITRVLKKEE